MRRFTLLLIVGMAATAVLALFTFFTPIAQADEVGGIIDTDTTWTLAGSPYIITDTVIIQPGVTLTVEAGVEVQAQPGTGMAVNGTLLAIGTPAQPITFTSTTETGPGDWVGISVNSTGSLTLSHITVRYGNIGLSIIGASFETVVLEDSALSHNQLAITVYPNALHRLQMNNLVFSNNDINRVYIAAEISNDELLSNTNLSAQPGLDGYEIPYPLSVPEGITLTLQPGVTIMGSGTGYVVLSVEGHLQATGTSANPITFTSSSDSSPGEWTSLGISQGSAHFEHVNFRNSMFNLDICCDPAGGAVVLKDSMISNSSLFGGLVTAEVLHRLEMDNVTFSDNGLNRIIIDTVTSFGSALAENVRLTPQPGLEGYEIRYFQAPGFATFEIPVGITLTLEAGTTVFGEDIWMYVNGHLAVEGTITATSTISGFDGLYVSDTGSITTNHAHFYGVNPPTDILGIGFGGNSDSPIHLQNTTIEAMSYPILAELNALHRLQMDNVTFTNNSLNRVIIHIFEGNTLGNNTTLTTQPGLEGYEIESSSFSTIEILSGITLTIESGTTLFGENVWMFVNGHLSAAGTITATSTISGFDGLYVSGTGSINANHAHFYGMNSPQNILGIGFGGNSERPIHLQNTTIEAMSYPIFAATDALHRLQMDNVTFVNNDLSRIIVDTYDSNTLADNVTLTSQPGLEGYEIQDYNSLIVPEGITLTLAANTTLMLPTNRNIVMEGHLQAEGTAVAPVTFTSVQDNAPGQWQGIVVNGGEVSLAHAEVRYATNTLTVNSPTSTVAITSSRLISASVDSIAVNDGTLYAACSVIAGNGQNGVSVAASGSPSVTITTSEIWGNGVGITNSHSLPVDGRHNFWGDASGPGGSGPGSGDAVYGNVLYDPWLAEPTCSPPVPGWQIYLPIIINH